MAKVTVVVAEGADSHLVRLMVNGHKAVLKVGQPSVVDETFIPAMNDAGVKYAIIPEGGEATTEPAAPAEEAGEAAPDPAPDVTAILDQSIAEIEASLEGLSEDDLNALLAAETAGKTRKGAVEAIKRALGA